MKRRNKKEQSIIKLKQEGKNEKGHLETIKKVDEEGKTEEREIELFFCNFPENHLQSIGNY